MKEDIAQVTVNKDKATQYGISLSQIKDQLNEKFLSFPAGNVVTQDVQIPIRVEQKVETINELENLVLSSSFIQNGPQKTLKDIATIENLTDQSEITRYNLNDSLSMALTKKQDANTVDVAKNVLTVLNRYSDDIDYAIGFDSAEGIEKSVDTLIREGIVTTNAIVLIDRVGQNREEKGMVIREALIEAGKTRLRPILMTAFATIAALLPLAFTTSSGTLISKGLAITVIGGLTSSTLLTLIILPVVYELFFRKQS